MFKKAQGLPMTTIVLIIMVLLVLVSVSIFFFSQFGQTSAGANEAQCVQKCQTLGSYYAQPGATKPTTLHTQITSFCTACKENMCNVPFKEENCPIKCKAGKPQTFNCIS